MISKRYQDNSISTLLESIEKFKLQLDNKPLLNQLSDLKRYLQRINLRFQEYSTLDQKYLEDYPSQLVEKIKDIQHLARIQKKTSSYEPSSITNPLNNMKPNLNFTQDTKNKIQQKYFEMKFLLESIKSTKLSLENFQQENDQEILLANEEMTKLSSNLSEKRIHIQQSDFYKNDSAYIKMTEKIIEIALQVEELIERKNSIQNSQQLIFEQKNLLDQDLNRLIEAEKQICCYIKQAEEDYEKIKGELTAIQEKHIEEKQKMNENLLKMKNKLQNTFQLYNNLNILLIDEYYEEQNLEKNLIEFIKKSLKDTRNQILKYKSHLDRWSLQNFSCTNKFSPKFTFQTFNQSIEYCFKNVSHPKQINSQFQFITLTIVADSSLFGQSFHEHLNYIKEAIKIITPFKHKLKIFIFDKYNSSNGLFSNFTQELKQNQFHVEIFFELTKLMNQIQQCSSMIGEQKTISHFHNQEGLLLQKMIYDTQQIKQYISKCQEDLLNKLSTKNSIIDSINGCQEIYNKNADDIIKLEQIIQQKNQEIILQNDQVEFLKIELINKQISEQLDPINLNIFELSEQLETKNQMKSFLALFIPQINQFLDSFEKQIKGIVDLLKIYDKEIFRLFSIIWALQGNKDTIIIQFSILHSLNIQFEENLTNNLMALLNISNENARILENLLKFELVTDKNTQQKRACLNWVGNYPVIEYQQYYDKLNILITPEVQSYVNSIKTYPNFEEFYLILEQYKKDLSL